MAHLRVVALLLALCTTVALGSSCSGSSTSAEGPPPSPAPASEGLSRPNAAADRALARHIILGIDDLSHGWQKQDEAHGETMQASDLGQRTNECPTPSEAAVVTELSSPRYGRRAPAASISSSVTTYLSEQDAARALSEFSDEEVLACYASLMKKTELFGPGQAVSLKPLTVPQLVDGSAGILLTVGSDAGRNPLAVYSEVYAVRAGRILVVVNFASPSRPFDPVRRDALIATLASRVAPLVAADSDAGHADSPSAPRSDIYLIALDTWSSGEPALLADRLEKTFGLCVDVLEPHALGKQFVSPARQQLDGDEVGAWLAERQAVSPESGLVVGITSEDMFLPEAPADRFAFAVWKPGYAVISSARMDPANVGGKGREGVMRERLWKMTLRYLGLSYFELPRSPRPGSVLRTQIRSLSDLDAMGSRLASPGDWAGHGREAAKKRCAELRGQSNGAT